MENTGLFKDHLAEMTSILIADTDSANLTWQKDEQTHLNNLDSLADQVLDFTLDTSNSQQTKNFMPMLGLRNERTPLDQWQNEYLRQAKHDIQELIKKMNTA